MSDDPKFDQPPPFRPPEPPPYRLPERPPSEPPPFRPPDAPPFDNPSRNPWGRGWALSAVALALVALPVAAHATTATGGNMPWDTPLQTLQQDLTGGTATSISLIGVVAIFGVLIFGGELNHFFRSICYVVLLVATLVAGQNLLTDFGIVGVVAAGNRPIPWLAIAVVSALIVVAAAVLAYLAIRFLRARRMDHRAAL